MKIKRIVLMGIMFLVVPTHAMAALVFQDIVTVSGYNDVYNFSFTADIEAPTYVLTVIDLSTPPEVVALNPRTAWTDSINPGHALFGFGSQEFTATMGATYSGYILADGVGTQDEMGTLMLRVEAVPIPPALLLLGSGLLVMMGFKKKVLDTIQPRLTYQT